MMIDIIVVERRAAEHGAVILVMQLQFADDAEAIMDQRTLLEVAIAVIGVDRLRQTLAFEAEDLRGLAGCRCRRHAVPVRDRTSVVSGKSVSVRVDLGGRRIIKKK